MITNLMILAIIIHWSFALGAMIAMRSNISIGKFLMIMVFIKYTLYSYGL